VESPAEPPISERIAGCLLGGAVGDALGAPVEFLTRAAILDQFGADGITDFAEAYGRLGAITDDTQMTMFTAEGLIRAAVRQRTKGICHPPTVVHHAYLRWLRTQGEEPRSDPFSGGGSEPDGWLVELEELWARRAPGNTCLAALRSGTMGTVEEPINDSKGCGGVMRAAPVGLCAPVEPFRLGCDIAAITHGHPSGYLAAGFLAQTIATLAAGGELDKALDGAEAELRRWEGSRECLAAVDAARNAARTAEPTVEALEALGEGWVAEGALAIAVYCAAGSGSFENGVRLAVNHGGDSDSTGAMAGNLLGAMHGLREIPASWRQRVELHADLTQLASDIHRYLFTEDSPTEADRYPGW
jgi:ADP-ribosyl-[dinitrogen reductase] hydrolase